MNNTIIERLERIETKLDAVIKALHDYDEGTLHCEYSGLPSVEAYSDEEYGESSFEAFMDNKVKDDNDIQDERGMVVEKKRNNGRESGIKAMNEGQPKQKQYYKNKRSKRNNDKH